MTYVFAFLSLFFAGCWLIERRSHNDTEAAYDITRKALSRYQMQQKPRRAANGRFIKD